MPELSFAGLERRFDDVVALEGIHLEVPDGSLTAIVGPSGCGKSTLLELAGGLQAPSAGDVRLDGRPVDGPRGQTALIFQHHNLFPWLTVLDNVAFGLRNRGVRARDARARALAGLRDVGLHTVAGRVPAELSGGMRQRVALARALVLETDLLLMDEPFASLDHQTRRLMHAHLLATWKRLRATIVVVTHDLDEALLLAERVVLMTGAPGRIAEVVDVHAAWPRDLQDPVLAGHRARLATHLEREVALGELTDAERERVLA